MAILVISQVPSLTAEQYEAIVRQVGPETNRPGQLLRLAGPVDGGWRVISVWESQEAYEAFRRDQLMPVVTQQREFTDQVQLAPLHSVEIAPQHR